MNKHYLQTGRQHGRGFFSETDIVSRAACMVRLGVPVSLVAANSQAATDLFDVAAAIRWPSDARCIMRRSQRSISYHPEAELQLRHLQQDPRSFTGYNGFLFLCRPATWLLSQGRKSKEITQIIDLSAAILPTAHKFLGGESDNAAAAAQEFFALAGPQNEASP